MRFKSKYSLRPYEGQTRTKRKFLLWPRCFENEWRWFEWTEVVEQVLKIDVGGSMEWGCYAWKWCEIDFADHWEQMQSELEQSPPMCLEPPQLVPVESVEQKLNRYKIQKQSTNQKE